jgi:hypothetical protein
MRIRRGVADRAAGSEEAVLAMHGLFAPPTSAIPAAAPCGGRGPPAGAPSPDGAAGPIGLRQPPGQRRLSWIPSKFGVTARGGRANHASG